MSGLAYAFYATSSQYALAVIVFVSLLRRLGLREDVELVLIHTPLPVSLLEQARRAGLTTREVRPAPLPQGGYYRHSLVKLRIFELTEYDRVIYADADAIPLRPLDSLFDLDLPGPLAAPAAYWLDHPFWSTHLMVIRPSLDIASRLGRHFPPESSSGWADMDIVNHELRREITTLPPAITLLNSEWERGGRLADPAGTYAKTSLVHFTALGKPWSYTPARVHALRADAHPLFFEMWERWWTAYDDVLRGCSRLVRMQSVLWRLTARARDEARSVLRSLRTPR